MSDMEQYRRTLQRRMGCYRLWSLAYLVVTITMRFAAEEAAGHPAYSLLQGCGCAAMVLAAIQSVRISRALRDETALRRFHNQEHDERMQAIRAKAGVPVTLFMGAGLIAAGLVATFLDMTAALTLVTAGMAELLLTLALKAWYSRRM